MPPTETSKPNRKPRMVESKALRFAELPDILTPRDLIAYLPIGRDSIYAAVKSRAIRSVRVGQKIIIPKAALREFLGGAVE